MRRTFFALGALLMAASAGGCVEVDEQWTFRSDGGGTYHLSVAWDADLWRRARDACGHKAVRTLGAKRTMPLRALALRDSLERLPGITIQSIASKTRDDGYRTLAVQVDFRKLADLLQWEVMASRPIRLDRTPATSDAPRTATLVMQPFLRLPVVDDALAAHRMVSTHPKHVFSRHGPLARWGVAPDRARLVWNMIRGPLQKVSLKVRVKTPGAEALFEWNADRVRKGASQRALDVTWRLSEFDKLEPVAPRPGSARK